MAVSIIGPKFYAWDRNGNPLAFGKLYTYQARTNTPKYTYQSEDQQVANTNPVILNGEGYANVYLDGSYKMVLKDSDDNEIWSADPVSASQPTEWVNCLQATYLSSTIFKVPGNFVTQYSVGRKVRINNGVALFSYAFITSSSFNSNETTIVVDQPVVTTGIVDVCHSIVSPDSTFGKSDLGGLTDYTFKNISDLKIGKTIEGITIDLTKLTAGSKVSWMGYHVQSDGGSNWGRIQFGAHTEDGGKIFSIDSNTYIEANLLGSAVSVLKYGAKGDGIRDDAPTINLVSQNHSSVRVPKRTYLMKSKVSIRAGQCWLMDNPLFTQDGVAFTTILEADDIADWSILGKTRIKGTLVTSSDVGAEKGLVVKGCSKYLVEGISCETMRSHGIHIMEGASAPAPRGDQGQFLGCSAHKNRVGVEVDAHTSAEFNTFTNFQAAGNLDGIIVGAGNTSFIGGNCVDNTRGVTLLSGANHAHGEFSGMRIDHNNEYNLKTVSVTNGHTFTGCHFYGNGGSTAPIWFENSKGMNLQGGVVDCAIRNDGTTGQNAICNNYIPSATPALFGTNPEYLRMLDNFDADGSWVLNDPAQEYTLLSRGASGQAIPPATVLIFNSATKDKRGHYNLSTGEYTAPVAGVYRVKSNITITGSGFTAAGASFVILKVNNVTKGYMPVISVSDTIAIGDVSKDLLLTAGDVVTLESSVGGTSPVLAITSSTASFELT